LKNKLQERRQREKKANSRETLKEPAIEWPPKRKHHTRPPSPRTKYVVSESSVVIAGSAVFAILITLMNHRLDQRQVALIELGMITSPDDIPTFAQNLYASCCRCPSFFRADM
jgi:DNA excision repair protein ERCC-6-like 2